VIDLVEKGAYIQVHYPALAGPVIPLRRSHGVVGTATGAESVAVRAERFIQARTRDLPQRLLDHPILYGRDPEQAFATGGFGDTHTTHRARYVLPCLEFGHYRRAVTP